MTVAQKINRLIKEKRTEDVFILARYFYRIGEPVFSDAVYDKLESVLREKGSARIAEYLHRSYDDDEVPDGLLKEIGEEPAMFLKKSGLGGLAAVLDDDKSLSIESAVSAGEAYSYFMSLRENRLDFMASLKTDGVNTKMLYVNGRLNLSLSRGRGDREGLDYMEGSSKVMPLHVEDFEGFAHLKVTGESYVDKDALADFRKKYDSTKYKTCKSSAISMLRTKHARADYSRLHTLVFRADGLADTMSEMFNRLEADGFETVPHRLHSWREIPAGRDAFKQWLEQDVMMPIWDAGIGIPSDGCVVEVDDLTWDGEVRNQYSTRQLALKFGAWKYKVYKGVITDIILEQKRVYKSVRITIEPIITDDDCKAEVINSFNPSILIDNDLYVGKEVYFEKNSGAVNILIHGMRLKMLMGDFGE